MKKKTIAQITRSLLVDSGIFGYSRQIAEHQLAFTLDGKTFTLDGKTFTLDGKTFTLDGKTFTRDDAYLAALEIAFEKWKATHGPTPRAAFADAVKRYGERYGAWRSPHGRPFPDHYFDTADDEARRIMEAEGIS